MAFCFVSTQGRTQASLTPLEVWWEPRCVGGWRARHCSPGPCRSCCPAGWGRGPSRAHLADGQWPPNESPLPRLTCASRDPNTGTTCSSTVCSGAKVQRPCDPEETKALRWGDDSRGGAGRFGGGSAQVVCGAFGVLPQLPFKREQRLCFDCVSVP